MDELNGHMLNYLFEDSESSLFETVEMEFKCRTA